MSIPLSTNVTETIAQTNTEIANNLANSLTKPEIAQNILTKTNSFISFKLPLFFKHSLYSLSIFCWQDIAEIILISGVLFYGSLWFRQDKQKKLLVYLYSYIGIFLITNYLQLITISTMLLTFAPVIIITCILLHQETFQKNFIALHKITPAKTAQTDTQEQNSWIELIIRSALVAAGNNTACYFIIEKQNALDTLLQSSFILETKITETLLQLILTSQAFKSEKLIWLDSTGKLRAINCNWHKNSLEQWLSQDTQQHHNSKFENNINSTNPEKNSIWTQDALFFTAKTDALCFNFDPATRTVTLVFHGTVTHNLSAHAAVKAITHAVAQVTTQTATLVKNNYTNSPTTTHQQEQARQ